MPPDPPTRASFARHNSRQRITLYLSSTPCFTGTPLQKSWRPWKAKGVVSLPLDGACVVQVTAHYQQFANEVIEESCVRACICLGHSDPSIFSVSWRESVISGLDWTGLDWTGLTFCTNYIHDKACDYIMCYSVLCLLLL